MPNVGHFWGISPLNSAWSLGFVSWPSPCSNHHMESLPLFDLDLFFSVIFYGKSPFFTTIKRGTSLIFVHPFPSKSKFRWFTNIPAKKITKNTRLPTGFINPNLVKHHGSSTHPPFFLPRSLPKVAFQRLAQLVRLCDRSFTSKHVTWTNEFHPQQRWDLWEVVVGWDKGAEMWNYGW